MKHHQASFPPDSPRTNRKMDMVVRSDRREVGWATLGLVCSLSDPQFCSWAYVLTLLLDPKIAHVFMWKKRTDGLGAGRMRPLLPPYV